MLSSIKSTFQFSSIATLTFAMVACGGGGGSSNDSTATTKAVDIQFAAKAGSQDASCGKTVTNIGSKNTTAKVRDLRFYASEIYLTKADNTQVPVTLDSNDWQNGGVVLLDLEDASDVCATGGTTATNLHIKGTVPAGTYTGVSFTVGVPESVNHTDYAVATKPLDVQGLAWSWQSGRKFLKLEVNPDGGVTKPATATTAASNGTTFNVHLGATGCAADTTSSTGYKCTALNHMAFNSSAFDASTQKLVVDVQTLLADSDITTDNGGAAGCMSGKTDPECAAVFSSLKIDLATGVAISNGSGQKLFRVEAK